MSMIRMKDIAIKTGYSLTTVSRALNGKEDISYRAREEILAMAKKMGYAPHELAKALVRGRTGTIGVVISDISDPYFGEIVNNIEELAKNRGYQIILCNTNEDPEQERQALETLVGKRVDGIIMTPSQGSEQYNGKYYEMEIPMVLASRSTKNTLVNNVNIDDQYGGFLAAEHLCKLGHRNLVYLNVPLDISSAKERLLGFSMGVSEYGGKFIEKVCLPSMSSAYEATISLVNDQVRFTAIAGYCDVMVIGCMRALLEKKYHIPNDVSIIGNDNIKICSYTTPMITTIDGCKSSIAETCFKILIQQIEQKQKDIVKHVIKPVLIIRESTAPASGSV